MVRKRPEMLLRDDPTHCECGVRLDVHPPLPDIKLMSWRESRPKLSHASPPAPSSAWRKSATILPSQMKQRGQENEQERQKRKARR